MIIIGMAAIIMMDQILMLGAPAAISPRPDHPLTRLLRTIIAIALVFEATLLLAKVCARIACRHRPCCRNCSIDAVDCKIRPNTVMPRR